jgi:rhodanese-related sulfurtransferase
MQLKQPTTSSDLAVPWEQELPPAQRRFDVRRICGGLGKSGMGIVYLVYEKRDDKNIIVICQGGYNAPIVAYYLKSKRFKNVSFLLTGMVGWKFSQSELYKKYAGENIEVLHPDR